jgi:hypothetical protein
MEALNYKNFIIITHKSTKFQKTFDELAKYTQTNYF